ncbi:Arc family DNA-binding protein [Xenorhabdus bovienii]|uniref:Arc family DNA-binding protein n=1 Tax=Xenorhabdus bovienii TaxID=40576 RepID=UPI0023B23CD3|nr:Arc family DNA-binding protein [Xenorhabdus bovienii]MDE9483482.1 Arc family DNA-binding protein [Xenorhabdus bovienii]MDE9519678.1 Arc family DNA-binding protein [Xenorhabdus bovienii]
MTKYPSQMQDKFNLRFPDGMRDAVAEKAKKNGRSMNSEIIAALESWIGGTSPPHGNQLNKGESLDLFVEIEDLKDIVIKQQEDIASIGTILAKWSRKKDR